MSETHKTRSGAVRTGPRIALGQGSLVRRARHIGIQSQTSMEINAILFQHQGIRCDLYELSDDRSERSSKAHPQRIWKQSGHIVHESLQAGALQETLMLLQSI